MSWNPFRPWKVFKNPWFWVLWGAISLIGGVLGYFLKEQFYNELDGAKVCSPKSISGISSIFLVEDKEDVESYIRFHESPADFEHLPFPLATISEKQNVYVLDTLENNKIYKIIYEGSGNAHSSNKHWINAFIYSGYLMECIDTNTTIP